MYKITLYSIFLLATVCCTNSQSELPKKYYDLQGFINTQIALLNKAKPNVQKRMQVGDAPEQVKTNNIDWAKELELFTQADLNKAALQLSYDVARPDSLTYQYKLKTTENLTVKSLVVHLDSASRQPARVEALLVVENRLYKSEKKILLLCGQSANQWMLQKYQILGYQKLILGGQKKFEITGLVKH